MTHEFASQVAERVLEADRRGEAHAALAGHAGVEHDVLGALLPEMGVRVLQPLVNAGQLLLEGEALGKRHQADLAVGVDDFALLEQDRGVVVHPHLTLVGAFQLPVVVAHHERYGLPVEVGAQALYEGEPPRIAAVTRMPVDAGHERGFRPDHDLGIFPQRLVAEAQQDLQRLLVGVESAAPRVDVLLHQRHAPLPFGLVVVARGRAVRHVGRHQHRPAHHRYALLAPEARQREAPPGSRTRVERVRQQAGHQCGGRHHQQRHSPYAGDAGNLDEIHPSILGVTHGAVAVAQKAQALDQLVAYPEQHLHQVAVAREQVIGQLQQREQDDQVAHVHHRHDDDRQRVEGGQPVIVQRVAYVAVQGAVQHHLQPAGAAQHQEHGRDGDEGQRAPTPLRRHARMGEREQHGRQQQQAHLAGGGAQQANQRGREAGRRTGCGGGRHEIQQTTRPATAMRYRRTADRANRGSATPAS